MRKFGYNLFVFLFPIIVLLFFIELSLRTIPNDYSYKKKYLDKNSNKINVLFLGNSHIFFGIDPAYIQQTAFNGSHISQSLNYDLAIFEKYEKNWEQLKCVVIPVDYFSLYSSLEKSIEKWRIKNYYLYYNINLYDEFQLSHYLTEMEIINGKFAENVKRLKNYYIKNKSNASCNELGWGTEYSSKKKQDLIKTGIAAASRHTKDLSDKACFDQNIAVIKSFISLAESKNIKLIFLTCPAYKTYTSILNKKQLDNTIAIMTEIASEHPCVFYYNLLNDTSFVKNDFFDADHLNEIGAKKFSLKLDSLIRWSKK